MVQLHIMLAAVAVPTYLVEGMLVVLVVVVLVVVHSPVPVLRVQMV
jgi:hypothetical protein